MLVLCNDEISVRSNSTVYKLIVIRINLYQVPMIILGNKVNMGVLHQGMHRLGHYLNSHMLLNNFSIFI